MNRRVVRGNLLCQSKMDVEPRLFMEHVGKGFQPGVFVRSQPGFS